MSQDNCAKKKKLYNLKCDIMTEMFYSAYTRICLVYI